MSCLNRRKVQEKERIPGNCVREALKKLDISHLDAIASFGASLVCFVHFLEQKGLMDELVHYEFPGNNGTQEFHECTAMSFLIIETIRESMK